jgi:hypothetical protein
MKHLKLFEEHLNELDYGKKLFADPAYISSSGPYRTLAFQLYSDETEKDTEDEKWLWMRIKDYFKNNVKTIAKYHKEDLKTLLKLKKKFPEMLDPSLVIKPNDMVWRGQSGEVNQVVEWIENCEEIVRHEWKDGWITLKGIKDNVKSRNDNGFISISNEFGKAVDFTDFAQNQNRWAIAVGTPFKNVAKNAFMNPKFAIVMSGFEEGETWILGNTIKATEISIAHPESWQTKKVFDRGRDMIIKALKNKGYTKGIVDKYEI